MSRARPTHRRFTVAGAVLLATLTSIPANAASPDLSTPTVRRGGSAWDQPTADDPSRLIVTFRPGVSAVARKASLARAGADRMDDVPGTRAMTLRAQPGRSSATLKALRADS